MMPSSAKGRARKVIKRYPVPLPSGLAAALAKEAHGRPKDAPLLTQPNGAAWGFGRSTAHLRGLFRAAVTAAALDPGRVTPYALRHSSIIRQLQRNVPIRLTAALHDTSVAIIEKNYSAYIAHHADEIARGALLDTALPSAANVVALSTGRRP